MIDKQTALTLKHGDILYSDLGKGSDRRPIRCRVNGKCKTWKTRPNDFRLPVKRGMYEYFYLGNDSFTSQWHVRESDAIDAYEKRIASLVDEILGDNP